MRLQVRISMIATNSLEKWRDYNLLYVSIHSTFLSHEMRLKS